jgi:hypothetical protein
VAALSTDTDGDVADLRMEVEDGLLARHKSSAGNLCQNAA